MSKLWLFKDKKNTYRVVGRCNGDCELYINNVLLDRKNEDKPTFDLLGKTDRGDVVKAVIKRKPKSIHEESIHCALSVNDQDVEWFAIGAG